jgi:hypothetical protein
MDYRSKANSAIKKKNLCRGLIRRHGNDDVSPVPWWHGGGAASKLQQASS